MVRVVRACKPRAHVVGHETEYGRDDPELGRKALEPTQNRGQDNPSLEFRLKGKSESDTLALCRLDIHRHGLPVDRGEHGQYSYNSTKYNC